MYYLSYGASKKSHDVNENVISQTVSHHLRACNICCKEESGFDLLARRGEVSVEHLPQQITALLWSTKLQVGVEKSLEIFSPRLLALFRATLESKCCPHSKASHCHSTTEVNRSFVFQPKM